MQNAIKIDNIVIIDSNFVLLPVQFKIDYLSDIVFQLEGTVKFIIFEQVLGELRAKKLRNPYDVKFQTQYYSGKSYLKKNEQKYILSYNNAVKDKNETTDNFLIRKSVELKTVAVHVFLATNDSELRKKARKSNIGTIFLRQKKYLSFER
jgi:rRNA-processing protein FCF1